VTTRIIAEFCQNHNGDFETLKRMIWEAAEGGATHGKVQTIFADDLAYRPEFEQGASDVTGTIRVIKRPHQPEYERLKKLELSYDQHREFVEECAKAGIEPLTTVFTVSSVPRLKELGFRALKIASYDCGSLPLVKRAAAAFSELFVSTGASYDVEIEATAACLRSSSAEFSLLHCVTLYPTPLSELHLRRLEYLKKLSSRVGLSDHTLAARDGVKGALSAIHLGASVIERHFTILPDEATRDGRVSIRKVHLQELSMFCKLSAADRETYLQEHVPELGLMLGSAERTLSHEELLNRAYYRGRFCNKIAGKQVFNWEYPD
jgi:N,N'-diacetyllegionaminate synthase